MTSSGGIGSGNNQCARDVSARFRIASCYHAITKEVLAGRGERPDSSAEAPPAALHLKSIKS